jgi:SAM-dependent methyltransferase
VQQWFDTSLGKCLLHEENLALATVLPSLFGCHLLQIGAIGRGQLVESSPISNRYLLNEEVIFSKQCICVRAIPESLPFAHDSVDVVILPHVLEFEENPHEILREVERVLIAEGHIIILGFNPFSLWGIFHLLARRTVVPWCSQFLNPLRIKDWLALLGFELISQRTVFFAPPFQKNFINYRELLEKIGSRWMSNFGAVTILVAKKRVLNLIPLKRSWRLKTPLVVGAVSRRREEC